MAAIDDAQQRLHEAASLVAQFQKDPVGHLEGQGVTLSDEQKSNLRQSAIRSMSCEQLSASLSDDGLAAHF